MKKIILCACLMAMLHPAFSQLYVRASVGYNLPMGSELMGTNETYEQIPDAGYIETFEGVYGSYGTGFSASAALGGTFGNGLLGYDAAFGYLLGKEHSVSSVSKYQGSTYSSEVSKSSRSFQFSPSLSIMVGSGKFQPFMRVGPVLGITKLLEERHERNTYDGITDFIWKYEYTGGLSLGFRGAVGVTYGLNEKLKLFSEINFQSMSYAPTKRTLTAYTVNGENRIDDISPENREQKLEKEYKTDSEEGTPPMRQPYSMNSWGLQVGVLFSFSK